MDLRQLRALVAVAEHGTFSAAAKALLTVQSNVSAHVARLERELGVDPRRPQPRRLTERGRRQSWPGPAASRPSSTRSRPTWPRLGDRGQRRRAPRRHRHHRPLARARPARRRSVSATPRSTPSWSTRPPPRCSPQLLSGTLDLAVVNLPVDDPELAVEPLFDEDLVLVAPDDHPLAAARPRSRSPSSADYPLLLSAPGTALRDELEVQAARAGVRLQRRRPRSTACVSSRRSRSKASGRRRCPRPRCRRTSRAPGSGCRCGASLGRSVGLAYRRRGHADAPGRRTSPTSCEGSCEPRRPTSRACTWPSPHRADRNGRNFRCVRVAIRAGTRGCVTARVDDIGGRPAVVVEIDPTDRKGALTLRRRRDHRDRGTHRARRADPPGRLHRVERRRHRRRHGRPPRLGTRGAGARRLLGHRAGRARGDRARGLRACAPARPRRPRGHDRRLVRVRERPDDGHRVHRGAHRLERARRRGTCTPRHTGAASIVVDDVEAAPSDDRAAARVPPCARRRGAAALADGRSCRPAHARGGRPAPRCVDRQLRRAVGDRGDRRRR